MGENKAYTHLLVCGDFNYPEINWELEITLRNANNPATLLMECLRDSFLFQHVNNPTHQRKEVLGNILDIILTREVGMTNEVYY